MNTIRRGLAVFAMVGAPLLFAPWNESAGAPPTQTSPDQLAGKTWQLERAYLISVHVPSASVDKVLQALSSAVGLKYGKYDHVAFIEAEGLEQYRPLAGSKAGARGAKADPSKAVTVSVVHDEAVLQKAVDAINRAHPYEEPVIYITEGWRSRSTSADENNPNRWWNQKPK